MDWFMAEMGRLLWIFVHVCHFENSANSFFYGQAAWNVCWNVWLANSLFILTYVNMSGFANSAVSSLNRLLRTSVHVPDFANSANSLFSGHTAGSWNICSCVWFYLHCKWCFLWTYCRLLEHLLTCLVLPTMQMVSSLGRLLRTFVYVSDFANSVNILFYGQAAWSLC